MTDFLRHLLERSRSDLARRRPAQPRDGARTPPAGIEDEGPPPGVPATGLKMLHDEAQGTAVVLQYFATAEDMDAGAQAFGAMDAAETPGTRASVDMCELKLEIDVS